MAPWEPAAWEAVKLEPGSLRPLPPARTTRQLDLLTLPNADS
jgi:hypothetical protein